MEAIIHPGMHKTGSSSIQATLVALKPEGWCLPDDKKPNMSGRFELLFGEKPHEFHTFKARGLTSDELMSERQDDILRLEGRFKSAFERGERVIFSAEHISAASRNSIEKFRDFVQGCGYQPRVVAYVRRPASFMQSAFQQRLKANLKELNIENAPWPMYRQRFEKLDEIFGRDNVQLTLFDQNELDGGDVCIDFGNKIGINIHPDQVKRVNESMSLQACALLFAQRRLGMGFVQGFDDVHKKNHSFIKALSRISGSPLKFKRSFLEPVFKRWSSDLEWMEERIGAVITDLPEEDVDGSVGSEEDLITIAHDNRGELETILIKEIRRVGKSPNERLIRNLELLRKLHY